VACLTLNRPERRNALSGELVDRLSETLRQLEGDLSIRAIIIAGAGGCAFSAGTDLKDHRRSDPKYRAAQRNKAWALNEILWQFSKPTVAVIHGWCLGGGLELAISCDFRIAASDAIFGFPELGLGAFPGAGAPVILPRLIGMTAAKDLLYTGRHFGAEEAAALGLVSAVTSPDAALPHARQFAQRFTLSSPLAIAALKRLFSEAEYRSPKEAGALSDMLHRRIAASEDSEEGLRARAEKRPPVFRGC